ncbi:MAG: GNAT family N-acetyltransferase [Candidatus Binatota bacterium]|nr:GNAT family N-acetyltransferase [Candidatus Binatota bacterium]
MNFPDTFSETTTPLPADQLGEAGAEAAQKLAGRGYEVHVGLTPEFADAISAMALEPSIREYCPKDCGQRFADRASTESWLAKGRSMFLLLRREGDRLSLAGYGWVGAGSNPRVPGGETTFAIRIGETGQGQGLATPFAWLIVAGAAALYGAKKMWLETWAVNAGAVHVYHKIGFETVTEEPDQRFLPSGEKVADVRVYMSLPDSLLPPPIN